MTKKDIKERVEIATKLLADILNRELDEWTIKDFMEQHITEIILISQMIDDPQKLRELEKRERIAELKKQLKSALELEKKCKKYKYWICFDEKIGKKPCVFANTIKEAKEKIRQKYKLNKTQLKVDYKYDLKTELKMVQKQIRLATQELEELEDK